MSEDTQIKNGADRTSLVDINKEMRESYLQYSMSVIVGRALPDVRDGLKPVHRRILFAMKDLNNTHNKPFKKSARVVGDVIGKYHPHGEMAVYDAIVRMAQDFSMQDPLIDGQGNFGSIDGDNAAAPRYTEIRMTALAEELLVDIDKETVPFGLNYDDTLSIPLVLPAKYPNLLVNGSAGIAVGMACNIPPHNLSEVIDGLFLLLENPEATVEQIMEKIPGPDFPTSGIIEGGAIIKQAYMKGRAVISITSKTEIEEEKNSARIIVTELPYQVNKARLIEAIAQLVKDKKVDGISDIRDESSREGLRVVIQVKRGYNAQILLNQLQKHSQLKTSFGIILLALDKNNQPQVFSLKQMLEVFIDHRKEVIVHRFIFDLRKAQEKLHILAGLEKALSEIDRVISIIRSSSETAQARSALISEMKFSHRQAQSILEMRLQKLTGLERKNLEKETKEVEQRVSYLKEILADNTKIETILREELEEIQSKYGKKRRTEIVESTAEITDRDLIKKEDVVVFLTYKGLAKKIPLSEYRLQKRGGKGLKGWELRTEEDFVWKVLGANTLDILLVFSSKGRVYWLDVFKISSGSRQAKARSLNNLLNFKEAEEPSAVLALENLQDKEAAVTMITKKGILKKTLLSLLSKPRSGGVIALSIDEGDQLQTVQVSHIDSNLFIFSKKGQVIRFQTKDLRPTGRASRGVRGIRLNSSDVVVSMECLLSADIDKEILVVTENGFGKRTAASQFNPQKRGGKGVLGQKITEKTGDVIYAGAVSKDQQVFVTTNAGQSIRFCVEDVSIFNRVSQGVRFIRLKDGEKVTGVTLLDAEFEDI